VTTALVISFSHLASDPRVDRQIQALRTRYKVIAAGLSQSRYSDVEFIDISNPTQTAFGRLLWAARLGLRRYEAAYWKDPANHAALGRLRDIRADVVVANEFEALPLALRLGPPVVFDAHEYSPEQWSERLLWRLLVAPYSHWQCRRYLPQVSSMTTVGQWIADEYERETGVRATVVTNAPFREDLEPTPVHHPVRILHHGLAVRGRGLEEMVRLADLLDDRFTLDFVLAEGTPGYRDRLIRAARANERVRFPDPRPMRELVRLANDYDVGLYLLSPSNVNRRYALPNKFFEFIQARLALAIGPSPEMARLVRHYGCGIIADDFTPESLARALNALDRSALAQLKRASDVAAKELCAEENEPLTLSAVEDALA
jgi:glycosyltransferase involved in cell wall biosynthesis